MFHPRSRNDQGDYCRQADLMSAQRLVCLRHDAGNFPGPYDDHALDSALDLFEKISQLIDSRQYGASFRLTGGIIPFWATTSIGIGTQTFRATPNRGQF
jgi:hypothetical protein